MTWLIFSSPDSAFPSRCGTNEVATARRASQKKPILRIARAKRVIIAGPVLQSIRSRLPPFFGGLWHHVTHARSIAMFMCESKIRTWSEPTTLFCRLSQIGNKVRTRLRVRHAGERHSSAAENTALRIREIGVEQFRGPNDVCSAHRW